MEFIKVDFTHVITHNKFLMWNYILIRSFGINSLSGELPKELGNLTQLKSLYVIHLTSWNFVLVIQLIKWKFFLLARFKRKTWHSCFSIDFNNSYWMLYIFSNSFSLQMVWLVYKLEIGKNLYNWSDTLKLCYLIELLFCFLDMMAYIKNASDKLSRIQLSVNFVRL